MSWLRQEEGGHANGYSNGQSRLYDLDTSSRDTSMERSRSRGPPAAWAGQHSNTNSQPDYRNQRVMGPAQLDRRLATNRRSKDRGAWDSSRSRSRPGYRFGDGSKQVEDILRLVDQQWSFMSTDSCVPVKVALQLMDDSSLGLADQYGQFQDSHQQLQSALKTIVNEHHQGFNSSIGTFHQIQASINSSQQRVRALRTSLLQAKGNLGTTRPELRTFATSSQHYDQMLQLLAHIDTLQTMPEKIEAQISEKRFLGAVETLQDALRLVRKPEMEDIGALSDLRVYFGNQEHAITDILVEELHSHLYLKSPYCENRWQQYASRTGDPISRAFDLDARQMYSFLDALDVSQTVVEDSSHNPESDTFSYIHLLTESLDRMSRLDLAVDAIDQRLPVELFRVVEKCYNEIEQRHPSFSRAVGLQGRGKFIFSTDDDQEKKEIVEDMLSSLYAKFEAIGEAHRVFNDVVSRILRRQGLKEPRLLRSFNELWKLYQSEIRSILRDHLATNADVSSRTRQHDDMGANMFRPRARDKTKKLFKLSDTDSASIDLATERDDLDFILKASVPGLVSSSSQTATKSSEAARMPDRSATGHKLLVQPSVFNMSLLLPPLLSFLNRFKDVVPQNSDIVMTKLTSFLDDFLTNVFYPQLEETLADHCAAASAELEAFQDDTKWQDKAQRPIFKSTSQLFDIVEAFCKMLDSLPPDQTFSQLIITQMRIYCDRCHDYYKSLVFRAPLNTVAGRVPRRSAELAEKGNISDVVQRVIGANDKEWDDAVEQESTALLVMEKARPLAEVELIPDRRSISQLCTLITSTQWLTAKIVALRHIDPQMNGSASSANRQHQRRWTSIAAKQKETQPYLPLSQESALAFDAVTTSFTELSSLALRSLHLEIRLQTLYGISNALSTSYLLSQMYNDPDPAVLSLNRSILCFYEDVTYRLTPTYAALVTRSLSSLADAALISYAWAVPAMDEYGNARMQLNILVLQQNLKEMDKKASLAQAARFWELWEEGPDAVLAACRGGLSTDIGRQLIRLCFSGSAEVGYEQKGLEEALAALEAL